MKHVRFDGGIDSAIIFLSTHLYAAVVICKILLNICGLVRSVVPVCKGTTCVVH